MLFLLVLLPVALAALTALEKAANETYDYIIVGGGAVGCPVAHTLAASGKKVLIIERGSARSTNDVTLDIFGAGLGMTDPRVSQLVVTKDGVRSHIGNGLGGGTAINFAIVIQEQWDYWHYIEKISGVNLDWDKLYLASNWTKELIAKDVPRTYPYGMHMRNSFETVYGPSRGSQVQLQQNSTWNGKTLFDPGSNWFRVASDYLLGVPNVSYPNTLSLLLDHTVHRITNFTEGSSGKLRANCVEVAPTTLADYDTILPGPPQRSFTSFLPLTSSTVTTFNVFNKPKITTQICVKEGGQIIAATGALLTPLLLWKSGIGPESKVRKARAERLVKEIPQIGENLRDRVFFPVGLFFDGELTDRSFPPRITQQLALTDLGPQCPCEGHKAIWEPTLGCSTVPGEELSGARIAEGAIYATRFIASPRLRGDPATNLVFQVMEACAEETFPLGSPLMRIFCRIANPAIQCFRRVAAPLSFISEPLSTAELDIDDDGHFIVDGHYLEDPVDVAAAIRAVGSTLAVIQTANLSEVMQPSGSDSCPMTILNTVVNLATQMMQNKEEITPLDGFSMEGFSDDFADDLISWANASPEAEGNAKDKASAEALASGIMGASAPGSADASSEPSATAKQIEGLREIFGDQSDLINILSKWKSQKYATYPPILPEPWDAATLEQFARSWMTSMWHWTGSASLGSVVDGQFTVKGFENLKIADASVLPRMSRMNPLFSLVTLGRYIGLVLAGCQ